ncbi:MAG: hypothetical protein JRF02_04785 [Deltaproteobacteria bacterium]|jgi:Spy/CpxP family protein refolding chaperone|nr:hypothetical protein [Deltaproteobacteria bacterium]
MLRNKVWFALLLIVLFVPSISAAQEMMHGKWWNDRTTAEELQLTENEIKHLEDKYTESRRKMIDLKSDLEKERLELDIALDDQAADKSRIKGHYEKLEAARAKLSKERFGFLLEVREIIGAQRFQALKEMHRSRKRNKMDRHPGDRTFSRGRY